MSTPTSPPTPAADRFVCACEKWMRRACTGENFYKEHDGKRYCVLHYPGTEKKEDFRWALRRKLKAKDFNFQGVWFPDSPDFWCFTFSADAYFNSAQFSADAYFGGAKFSKNANFNNAQFSKIATFHGAQFSKSASFDNAVFNATVYFHETRFIEAETIKVTFTGASFKDGVSFEDNDFAEHVFMSFAAAIFEKPERAVFHTRHLRPHWFINVDSRKFTFIDVKWGRQGTRDAIRREMAALKRSGESELSSLLPITYRQLAVNAEENNRYEEAADFRYMAMDARRQERWRKLDIFRLSWWYWLLSGYGERVQHAFNALAVIWLFFALVYWAAGDATWWQPKQSARVAAESSERDKQPPTVAGQPQATATAPLTLTEALIYSAGVMTLQKPEPLPANKRAKACVLLETILGPVQAALLALAIRRKFMR